MYILILNVAQAILKIPTMLRNYMDIYISYMQGLDKVKFSVHVYVCIDMYM